MSTTVATETAEDNVVVANSKKREVTAAVAGTVLTVALGVAANIAISKLTGVVQSKIAPKKTETE